MVTAERRQERSRYRGSRPPRECVPCFDWRTTCECRGARRIGAQTKESAVARAFAPSTLVIVLLTPLVSAQQVAWRAEGVIRDEQFGRTIAALPDRDGDGIAELLIGAPAR